MSELDTITIPMSAYEELLNKSTMLEFLQSAGVDNWDGYDGAMEMYFANFNSEY